MRVDIRFEPWDEVYLVRIDGPRGQKTTKHKTRRGAIRAATMLSRFPVSPLAKLEIGQRYFVAVVAELIAAQGGRATGVPTDLTEPDAVRRLFDRVEQETGSPPRLVLYNAGNNFPKDLLELADEEF